MCGLDSGQATFCALKCLRLGMQQKNLKDLINNKINKIRVSAKDRLFPLITIKGLQL